MNHSAQRHIVKAKGYLAKGEDYYHRAADEIQAARDEGATWPEIADILGRSVRWTQTIVKWSKTPAKGAPSDDTTPFSREHDPTVEQRNLKYGLQRMPVEQIGQVMSELPDEARRKIREAVGYPYQEARQEHDEAERNLTPAQRKEREASRDATETAVRRGLGGFTAMSITDHIEEATEKLQELIADSSLSPEMWAGIEQAIEALLIEAHVAAAMVGLEFDLERGRP